MPADQLISFGPYQLDRASGRLLRGGTNVPLRRKTFAVLEYLATRPGCLVAKHELLDAVWPATHVSPSVLAGCIRDLRQALGDDARAARFIETAHRRGYRFIAAPSASEAPLEGAAPRTVSRVLPGCDTELADLARRFAQAVAGVIERGRREGVSHSRARQGVARGPRRALHRERERGGGRKVR